MRLINDVRWGTMNKKRQLRFQVKIAVSVILAMVLLMTSYYAVSHAFERKDTAYTSLQLEIEEKATKDALLKQINQDGIPVLAYHGVTSVETKAGRYSNSELWIDDVQFDSHMKALHDAGYVSVTLDQFYEWYVNGQPINPKSVLITFDDGMKDVITYAGPVLKKYNYTAVSFNIGSWVKTGESAFISLEDMEASLDTFEHGNHSFDFHRIVQLNQGGYARITVMNDDDLMKDFELANQYALKPHQYFAYPFGSFNASVIDALIKNNYRLAFTFSAPVAGHVNALPQDGQWTVRRLPVYTSNSAEELISLITPKTETPS